MDLRIFCIHLLITGAFCEDLFSSTAKLEQLVVTESNLVQLMDEYLARETDRLDQIRRLMEEIKEARSPFKSNNKFAAGESVLNPIDVYLNIKRTVNNGDYLRALLQENTTDDLLSFLDDEAMPTEVDVKGAAIALLRLQDTYLLNPTDMADGKIGKLAQTIPMTADDTFKVGYIAFSNKDYYHALQWLLITKDKVDGETGTAQDEDRISALSVLYDHLAYAMHDRQNPEHALWYSRALNEIDPEHASAEYLDDYQRIFYDSGSDWDGSWENLPPVINERPLDGVFEEYESLCRGETKKTPSELSKLYCFRQQNTPYLKLAPMNVEIVNFDPYAVIFRGILSDSESEYLKRIASPELERALVVNDDQESRLDPEDIEDPSRVAKNMWLNDEDDKVAARISRRMAEVTGLSMETAEALQVANYGLGGHYEPHYDVTIDEDVPFIKKNGHRPSDRIATGLFYLSEPMAGGATVFDELGLAVFPTKNDCLFWFNMQKNGRPDMRTRHAGCPVLLGQKWVANKWINERGQEFRRPCDLSTDV